MEPWQFPAETMGAYEWTTRESSNDCLTPVNPAKRRAAVTPKTSLRPINADHLQRLSLSPATVLDETLSLTESGHAAYAAGPAGAICWLRRDELMSTVTSDPAVDLLSLSDDNLQSIMLLVTSPHTSVASDYPLQLVLVSSRFRELQLQSKRKLRTSLKTVTCSMNMLQWAIDSGSPYPLTFSSQWLLPYAASYCAIDVVRYAVSNGYADNFVATGLCDDPIYMATCAQGYDLCTRIAFVKYYKQLMGDSFAWAEPMTGAMCCPQPLEAVKALHELGCPFAECDAVEAASRGLIDMLKYLAEAG